MTTFDKTPRPASPRGPGARLAASSEAARLATAILHVLGGASTPQGASDALGISLPRYYQIEARALQGLITACEPRPPGQPRGLDRRMEELERKVRFLQRENQSLQSLVRIAQRMAGLAKLPAPNGSEARPPGRRKVNRALKVAEGLRKVGTSGTPPPVAMAETSPGAEERKPHVARTSAPREGTGGGAGRAP